MTRQQQLLERLFITAVDSVRSELLIPHQLRLQGDTLVVGGERYDLRVYRRVVVLAAGKAATSMTQAVEQLLGERISGGLAVTKHGFGGSLRRVELLEAGHPLPDEASHAAGERMLALAEDADEHTLALLLLSGGGSSLLCAPWGDDTLQLTLDDLRTTGELLLASGASIVEMNIVRRHLSRIKGGRLAQALHPARTMALVLSDVIGDDLASIASGPAAPDNTTFADAWRVIEKHGLRDRLPMRVRELLLRGRLGLLEDTPDADDPAFSRVLHHIIGSNATALGATAQAARDEGCRVKVVNQPTAGEASQAAARLYRLACEIPAAERPCLLLAGGETTVTLGQGHGAGGRNLELALAFLREMELHGDAGLTLLSAATDGDDGTTGAAGAWAKRELLQMARVAGCDIADSLRRHDAYGFFRRVGGLYRPGPTGVNVCDLQLIFVE